MVSAAPRLRARFPVPEPSVHTRRMQPTGERAADAIASGFLEYHVGFKGITRRARQRFATSNWHGLQRDASQRLDLYRRSVDGVVAAGVLDGVAEGVVAGVLDGVVSAGVVVVSPGVVAGSWV